MGHRPSLDEVMEPAQLACFEERLAGADRVVVGEDMADSAELDPYYLIVDQPGGQSLAEVMTQLELAGRCVSIGGTIGHEVRIDRLRMQQASGASLDFFNLYHEFTCDARVPVS
ncbi:MAG TPA: hypothetical protein VMV68_05085 [Spirochaetia bacterium]|nr:hypothetical protein [Spirochaetia bacterium]